MEPKVYSLGTAGNVLGITAMAVKHRADKLGIDTRYGVTAEEVKRIRDYKNPNSMHTKKATEADLRRELEVPG